MNSWKWMRFGVLTSLVFAGGCGDAEPIGEIILCSGAECLTRVVGDHHTVAFGREDLAPRSLDPPNTTHTLVFNFDNNLPVVPRQELISFDLNWEEVLSSVEQDRYHPVSNVSFWSVPAESLNLYSSEFGPTSHIVRYWHGQCAESRPWASTGNTIGIFDEISESIVISAALAGEPLDRSFDMLQPFFPGQNVVIDHGFSLLGEYTVQNVFTFELNLNFSIRANFDAAGGGVDNGRVEVDLEHIDVLGVPSFVQSQILDAFTDDPADPLDEGIDQAIEASINAALSVPLNTCTLDDNNQITCDPDVTCDSKFDLSEQQEQCFSRATEPGVGGGPGLAHNLFVIGLLTEGFSLTEANSIATKMVNGLVPQNFECANVILDSQGEHTADVCAFRPIVQRVNVLPNELEFVFAGEPELIELDAGPSEEDKVLLYRHLPAAVNAVFPGAGADFDFCDNPVGRNDGPLSIVTHGAFP